MCQNTQLNLKWLAVAALKKIAQIIQVLVSLGDLSHKAIFFLLLNK